LKPDVSAPGYFITSTANGQTNGARCDAANLNTNIKTLAGTSMATPVLAGHISMVREYFQSGFYPSGVRTAADGFNPSASLLKAIAIAGAQIMPGVKISFGNDHNGQKCATQARVALQKSPYYDQGYGRFQMNQILYFNAAPNRYLHIPSLSSISSSAANFWDMPITAGATQTYNYCVYPNSTVPTTVALVWTDAPSATNAAINLVNNLDLFVTYNGQTVAGNSQHVYFRAAGLSGTDTLNPVETVTFPGNTGAATPLTISVKCASLGRGVNQLYSLVVSGFVSQGNCATRPATAPKFLNGGR
jgi:hypothetical protein